MTVTKMIRQDSLYNVIIIMNIDIHINSADVAVSVFNHVVVGGAVKRKPESAPWLELSTHLPFCGVD